MGFQLTEVTVQSVQTYFGFREELAIVNGLIVKGHRVVIPSQLRDEALKLLHSSHMGIVKTKDRARTSFFWPSINRDIESIRMWPLCHIPGKTAKRDFAE